jgi:DNA-directed RNA polymerase specialized sigma24 family protein
MPGSITDALDRWRGGESAAQFDLERALQPFLLDLLSLVRRRRGKPLQPRIDSQAVVNEAWGSFLTGVRKDEFPTLQDRKDICRVLTTLVTRTLCDQIDWHTRQRRSPAREEGSPDGAPRHLADARRPAANEQSTAEEFADWLARFEELLRSFHPKAMDIVELSFQGLANCDIARSVGLSVRSVQLLRQRLAAAVLGLEPSPE